MSNRRYRSRRERGTPRAKTIAQKKITRTDRIVGWLEIGVTPEEAEAWHAERPKTRGECRDAPRPCPWVSCRHHLALEVNAETGSIKLVFPTREVWELDETCALDVADRGGTVLEKVGETLNLTRERVRQVETRGLLTLKFERPLGKDAA